MRDNLISNISLLWSAKSKKCVVRSRGNLKDKLEEATTKLQTWLVRSFSHERGEIESKGQAT